MIVNDDSSIVSKRRSYLIDDARVIIYDRNMFITQPREEKTGREFKKSLKSETETFCADKVDRFDENNLKNGTKI